MKHFVTALIFTLFSSLAFSNGEYLEAFLSHYKLTEKAAFVEKSCGICHASDSDFSFNPYGTELKKALADKGTSDLDGAVLVSIESLDADLDGTPNGNEIKNETFPGDPSSGGVPGVTSPPLASKPERKASPFPPKNAYHPAIVHFPIALFICGLILDFFGMLRKDKTLLAAGWYCIMMAAIASVAAVFSGGGAMALLKLPYRGLILNHIAYAIGAASIMWVMVALRFDRHQKMKVGMRVFYYFLATTCLVLISWAGHLGGLFVYGE